MIDLSAEWAREGYALRRARARDRSFQRALFATARPDAALIARWPPVQRDAFLDQQFALQDIHYRRVYAAADFLLVTHGGAPIGRLIVHKGRREWRVVDIGFVPERRGQGLGTALLRCVQDSCAAAGAATLNLQVEFGNRARGLYDRLGFVQTGDTGSHIEMVWQTGRQLKTAS
jgi:ribosomal protein S18 acetylase RimI-like enzyme